MVVSGDWSRDERAWLRRCVIAALLVASDREWTASELGRELGASDGSVELDLHWLGQVLPVTERDGETGRGGRPPVLVALHSTAVLDFVGVRPSPDPRHTMDPCDSL